MLRRSALVSNYDVLDENGLPLLWVEGTTPARIWRGVLTVAITCIAAGAVLVYTLRGSHDSAGYGFGGVFAVSMVVWLVAELVLLGTQNYTVYRDRTRHDTLLRIVQTRKLYQYGPLEFRLEDAGGRRIASFRQRRMAAFDGFAPDGTPLCVMRSSPFLSADRLFRSAYQMERPESRRLLGNVSKERRFLGLGSDRYYINLDAAANPPFDHRIALALGVLLTRRV